MSLGRCHIAMALTLVGVAAQQCSPSLLSLVQRDQGVVLKPEDDHTRPTINVKVAEAAMAVEAAKANWPFHERRLQNKGSDSKLQVEMCEVDIAAGKPISSDGFKPSDSEDYGPWNAVDGRNNSRWQSMEEPSNVWGSHWLQVDMTHNTSLTRVGVTWDERYAPHSWYAEVSADQQHWHQLTRPSRVYTNETSAAVPSKLGKSRYQWVRVVCEGFNNADGCSIRHLNLYTSLPCSILAKLRKKKSDETMTICSKCEVKGAPQVSFETSSGLAHTGDYSLLKDDEMGLFIQGRYEGDGSKMTKLLVGGEVMKGSVLVIGAEDGQYSWHSKGAPSADSSLADDISMGYQDAGFKRTLFVDFPKRVRLSVSQMQDHIDATILWQDLCVGVANASLVATHTWKVNSANVPRIFSEITMPQDSLSGYCGTDSKFLKALSPEESLFESMGEGTI